MSDDTNGYSDVIDRRKFIKLAGASGASALAGCTGGPEGTPTPKVETVIVEEEGETVVKTVVKEEETPDPRTEVFDATHKGATNTGVPANLHLNPMADQNYDWIAGRLVFERFAAFNFAKDDFDLAALDSWSIDEETVTLTLRDDLTWENGEPVTSRDVVTQFRLMKKLEATLWDFAESVEMQDDKTVVINLQEPSNPTIIKHTIGAGDLRIHGYHPVYKQFLDKPAEEVQTFQWEEDVVGNGPFSFDSKDQQAWTFTRNDNYHKADNINFTRYQLLNRQSNTAIQQGLRGGELDSKVSLFAPPKIVADFPDAVEEVNIPAKWGYGILFNHDHPDYGKREVRQAIAHVINRQQVVDNAGPRTKFPTPVITGIAPKNQKQWLGDQMSDFRSYGVDESQTNRAESLLQQAGYSKSNGKWQDDEGNTLSGDYITPAGWTDWTTASDTVVDQLNSFGFDLKITSRPTGDFFGGYIEGNFSIGSFFWLPGGARSAFPFFPLRYQLDPFVTHNFPEGQRTVPAMDGSGTMTINPLEEIKSVATTQDSAKVKQTIQRVAWHNNHALPMLSLNSKFEQSWLTEDEWITPQEDDLDRKVKWPPHWLPRQGKLLARPP